MPFSVEAVRSLIVRRAKLDYYEKNHQAFVHVHHLTLCVASMDNALRFHSSSEIYSYLSPSAIDAVINGVVPDEYIERSVAFVLNALHKRGYVFNVKDFDISVLSGQFCSSVSYLGEHHAGEVLPLLSSGALPSVPAAVTHSADQSLPSSDHCCLAFFARLFDCCQATEHCSVYSPLHPDH